jgi:hypothetical protein
MVLFPGSEPFRGEIQPEAGSAEGEMRAPGIPPERRGRQNRLNPGLQGLFFHGRNPGGNQVFRQTPIQKNHPALMPGQGAAVNGQIRNGQAGQKVFNCAHGRDRSLFSKNEAPTVGPVSIGIFKLYSGLTLKMFIRSARIRRANPCREIGADGLCPPLSDYFKR